MIFRENMSFAYNSTKNDVRVTSRAVLLAGWMDLNTVFAAQLRDIARVLGSQGAPTESDIDSVRASTQGMVRYFW